MSGKGSTHRRVHRKPLETQSGGEGRSAQDANQNHSRSVNPLFGRTSHRQLKTFLSCPTFVCPSWAWSVRTKTGNASHVRSREFVHGKNKTWNRHCQSDRDMLSSIILSPKAYTSRQSCLPGSSSRRWYVSTRMAWNLKTIFLLPRRGPSSRTPCKLRPKSLRILPERMIWFRG